MEQVHVQPLNINLECLMTEFFYHHYLKSYGNRSNIMELAASRIENYATPTGIFLVETQKPTYLHKPIFRETCLIF